MTQSNELRRERVAAALRNCCMDEDIERLSLNFASPTEEPEGEIVRALLRPISGKKVGAELSDNVRQACAEAIFALAKDEEDVSFSKLRLLEHSGMDTSLRSTQKLVRRWWRPVIYS